jgi:hypothetical protein
MHRFSAAYRSPALANTPAALTLHPRHPSLCSPPRGLLAGDTQTGLPKLARLGIMSMSVHLRLKGGEVADIADGIRTTALRGDRS